MKVVLLLVAFFIAFNGVESTVVLTLNNIATNQLANVAKTANAALKSVLDNVNTLVQNLSAQAAAIGPEAEKCVNDLRGKIDILAQNATIQVNQTIINQETKLNQIVTRYGNSIFQIPLLFFALIAFAAGLPAVALQLTAIVVNVEGLLNAVLEEIQTCIPDVTTTASTTVGV